MNGITKGCKISAFYDLHIRIDKKEHIDPRSAESKWKIQKDKKFLGYDFRISLCECCIPKRCQIGGREKNFEFRYVNLMISNFKEREIKKVVRIGN